MLYRHGKEYYINTFNLGVIFEKFVVEKIHAQEYSIEATAFCPETYIMNHGIKTFGKSLTRNRICYNNNEQIMQWALMELLNNVEKFIKYHKQLTHISYREALRLNLNNTIYYLHFKYNNAYASRGILTALKKIKSNNGLALNGKVVVYIRPNKKWLKIEL